MVIFKFNVKGLLTQDHNLEILASSFLAGILRPKITLSSLSLKATQKATQIPQYLLQLLLCYPYVF